MNRKMSLIVAATLACSVGAIALAGTVRPTAPGQMGRVETGKDIIDTATGEGMQEVTTLVAAVKAAGLVETLKGKGPFTVFAPTNEAFAKLPAGTVESLLKPENKDKLVAVLTYHVHAGKAIESKDVKTMELDTVNGQKLKIVVKDGAVMVNDAKVIKTDVVATNGVIHWIDTVVLPK